MLPLVFIRRKFDRESSEGRVIILNPRILAVALAVSLAALLLCAGMAMAQSEKRPDFPKAVDNGRLEAAKQAFSANCAGCHGLDGKGGERAPDIVTRSSIRQLSDSKLLQVLQKGVPKTSMPSFSYLGDQTLRSLVAHLRTLQRDRTTATLPGDAQRGEELFFGKGSCSSCHMVRGAGGFFASDLTAYALGRSPDKIRDAIVFPNRDLAPNKRTVVATLPDGQRLEGIARNEDNFSIQVLTPDGTLHLLPKSVLPDLTYRNESPMPADYRVRLSTAEIDDLVNYLSSIAKQGSKRRTREGEPD